MTAGENHAEGDGKSHGITADTAAEKHSSGVGATSDDGTASSVCGVEAGGWRWRPGLLESCVPLQRRLTVALPLLAVAVGVVVASCLSSHTGAADGGDSGGTGPGAALCDQGEFRLPGMAACRPLLDCSELAELQILELVGQGSTKSVYRALWRDHQVALSALAEPALRADFQHGLQMLLALSPSEHVVQLVGNCGDVIVTEFHRRGDAAAVAEHVATVGGAGGALLGLRFCRSYAAALAFLHDSPAGRRVMCDSNELLKTLQQWLVTGDGQLVAADLDALPDASVDPVHCGRRRIDGEFLAPEQRWRQGREPPGYDEKTDVWKLAAVCRHFLGETSDGKRLALKLHAIHGRCRAVSPSDRPAAAEVVAEYDRAIGDLTESGDV